MWVVLLDGWRWRFLGVDSGWEQADIFDWDSGVEMVEDFVFVDLI